MSSPALTDAVDLKTLRVAVHVDNGVATPTSQTIETIRGAASALRPVVGCVEEVRLPLDADASRLFNDLYTADGGAWRQRILLASATVTKKGAEKATGRGL